MWKKNFKKSWKCEYHYCITVIKDFLWKWKLLSHIRLFATPWTVHRILQARVLEWVAFPFSRGSSQSRDLTQVSCIAGRFFTSWVTGEGQDYWSGQPIPFPADLPNPGTKLGLLHCRWTLYQIEDVYIMRFYKHLIVHNIINICYQHISVSRNSSYSMWRTVPQ